MTTPNGPVDIYWRHGCPYCIRLWLVLAPLGLTRRARWHDIWSDPDAAAFVRSVAAGNETVPTVVIRGRAEVNPSPGRAVAALRATTVR